MTSYIETILPHIKTNKSTTLDKSKISSFNECIASIKKHVPKVNPGSFFLEEFSKEYFGNDDSEFTYSHLLYGITNDIINPEVIEQILQTEDTDELIKDIKLKIWCSRCLSSMDHDENYVDYTVETINQFIGMFNGALFTF